MAVLLFGLVLITSLPASAGGGVRISRIVFNPPGNDNGSNASLKSETVTIKNTGSSAVTLTDWILRDTDRHNFRFPEFTLRAGRSVTVHTGSGADTRRHLYWDQDAYVWNNDGDIAILRDDSGDRVDRCRYSRSGSSVNC